MHYGVLGQKWGVRRYQNEDGSLTNEGLQRLKQNGVLTGARSQKKYEPKQYGKKVSGLLGKKPTSGLNVRKEKQAKERAKKILLAVGGVALAGAGIYAIRRRSKVTQNLIQLGKNSVNNTYNRLGDKSPKMDFNKARDMSAINTRKKALKELGLKGHKQVRAFIKDNKIAKMKTHKIIEQRTGPLVEGYRKNAFGKMKPYYGWRINRMKKHIARTYYT